MTSCLPVRRLASLRFVTKQVGKRPDGKPLNELGFEILPQGMKSGPGIPKRLENMEGKFVAGGLKGHDTTELWLNFLECVRNKNRETFSTPELGAAAFTTVNLGVQSYRKGAALYWDKEQRKPTVADASWADRWEKRSQARGKPNQIIGWQGGDAGSMVEPPAYQKLGGPWVDGKDPAEGVAKAGG